MYMYIYIFIYIYTYIFILWSYIDVQAVRGVACAESAAVRWRLLSLKCRISIVP